MSIAVSEEHRALAGAVRDWAAGQVGRPVVRDWVAAAERGAEPDRPPFWPGLAAMGLAGVHVPAEHGGGDGGLADLAVVLEATGRALVPGPLLPTALAAAVLRAEPDLAKV